MGRGIYRSGLGSLLTPNQLAQNFALPVYRIITGSAKVVFPNSNVSNPSSYVLIQSSGNNKSNFGWAANLPLTLNWIQWENVIVPVLLDPRVTSWVGVLRANGKPVYLSNTVVGPNGQTAVTTSGLPLTQGTLIGSSSISGEQVSRLLNEPEYVNLIADLIRLRAEGAVS
jgi:hypothetical protein